jgi:hypothetical protein
MHSVAGFLGAVVDPSWFMAQQIPQTQTVPTTEGAVIVTMQLGNLYLLMAFMGLFILNTTSEAKVVRAYLLALWLGDIGHVGLSLYGLGWEKAMSISDWNGTTIGNVPVTVRTSASISPDRRSISRTNTAPPCRSSCS